MIFHEEGNVSVAMAFKYPLMVLRSIMIGSMSQVKSLFIIAFDLCITNIEGSYRYYRVIDIADKIDDCFE